MKFDQHYCVYKQFTYREQPVFGHEKHYQLLFDALSFLKNKYKLGLMAYLLLPNQVQLIIEKLEEDTFSAFTQNLKTITHNEVVKFMEKEGNFSMLQSLEIAKGKQKYRLWEKQPELEIIDKKETLVSRIETLHEKPVKMALADHPHKYRYSSAKFYLLDQPTEIKINDFRLLLAS